MTGQGLSERHALRVMDMSPSAYRYQPAADRNCALKDKIIALAQHHRRYGAGMIYLKLRQVGEVVNHKRVDRLYSEAGLQVKKRRRKKIAPADRHPLQRPMAVNQVWSMDFVFDRTAEGRSIKNLTIVDDATHEAVVIVSERAMGGNQLVQILEQLATTRGLPQAIRTDNGKEFCGRAHAELGACQRGSVVPDRTWQTAPERLHRVLQRALQGRGPERALVHQLDARPCGR